MLEVKVKFKNGNEVIILPLTAQLIEIEKEKTLIWLSEGYNKNAKKLNKLPIEINEIKSIEFNF